MEPSKAIKVHELEELYLQLDATSRWEILTQARYKNTRNKFQDFINSIPFILLTPHGIMVDRRTTYQLHVPERRVVNIIRHKLIIWIFNFFDDGSLNPQG